MSGLSWLLLGELSSAVSRSRRTAAAHIEVSLVERTTKWSVARLRDGWWPSVATAVAENSSSIKSNKPTRSFSARPTTP